MFQTLSPSPTQGQSKQRLSFLFSASKSHLLFSHAFPYLAVLTRVGRPVKLVMIALLLSTSSFSLLHSSQSPLSLRVQVSCTPALSFPSPACHYQLFWTQFLHLFCRGVHVAELNLIMYDGVQCKSFNQFLHHKSFFMQRWCQIMPE